VSDSGHIQGEAAVVHCTSKKQKRSFIMKRLIALILAMSYVMLAGCNTIQGAGKDVERGGEKIQKEAQEHKNY
jgi:predicted small secreted protein